MLLLLEVGNTNTGVGVHDGGRLVASWRLTSRREQTSDEYGLFIHTLLRSRDIEPRRITAVAISNVTPGGARVTIDLPAAAAQGAGAKPQRYHAV